MYAQNFSNDRILGFKVYVQDEHCSFRAQGSIYRDTANITDIDFWLYDSQTEESIPVNSYSEVVKYFQALNLEPTLRTEIENKYGISFNELKF